MTVAVRHLPLALGGLVGFLAILVGLEVSSRRFEIPPEHVRRLSHASASILAAVLGSALSAPVFLGIVALFVPVMLISRKRQIFNHIHGVARPTIGEELLSIGIISAYLIASGSPEVFVPAVLTVGIADPLTGVVMQRTGSHPLGFAVFFLITVALLAGFFAVPIGSAVVIAAVAAGAERLSSYGTDNLTIPIVVALALRLW